MPALPARAKRPAKVAAAILRCNSFIFASNSPQTLADEVKIEPSFVQSRRILCAFSVDYLPTSSAKPATNRSTSARVVYGASPARKAPASPKPSFLETSRA